MNVIRISAGIFLLVLGVSFLLDQLGLSRVLGFNLGTLIAMYWPLIVIALGVSFFSKGSIRAGLVFSFVGIVFLISTVFGLNAWGLLWPLFVMGLGIMILVKPLRSLHPFSGIKPLDARSVAVTALFWGVEQNVISTSFTGGDVTAVLGKAKIDMHDVRISPEGATLNVWSLCGGVEIRVPESIRVEVSNRSIVGRWENRFKTVTDPESALLTITGFVLCGKVEIRN